MVERKILRESSTPIKRGQFLLLKPAFSSEKSSLPLSLKSEEESDHEISSQNSSECLALVINASHEMAKEITLQLTLANPACSIMYAPSVEIAKWILKRKPIDIIVSSSLLPDGPVQTLKPILEELPNPPDLIVVGGLSEESANILLRSKYHFVQRRKVGSKEKISESNKSKPSIGKIVKSLGADIRNDLNNPLQEIVAMVFVAKASKASMPTEQALDAIDKAAKNMAGIVNALEGKIQDAVSKG